MEDEPNDVVTHPSDRESWMRLTGSLISVAEDFPWSVPDRDPRADWERMWWWWNVAFVRAATRLLRAIVILGNEGLYEESNLQLRSMLELVGNQGYMAQSPKARAAEFAAADLKTRERILDSLSRLGFDPKALQGVRDEIAQVRTDLNPLIEDVQDSDSIYPFGRKAKVRIESAGMTWHYDGVYERTSDYVHMNARALGNYLKAEDETRPETEEALQLGTVVLGCEFLIRTLYFADVALGQCRRDFLDGYALEYARLTLPDRDKHRVVQSLRPPPIA